MIMRSSLGLPLLLLVASVTPMNIKDLLDSYGCGEDNTTCPNETTCCTGSQSCCPVDNTYQCCPVENAICCPDWEEGPKCCFNFMQCAPNGSPSPCMVLTKPANVTFYGGLNLTSSFPASDVGP